MTEDKRPISVVHPDNLEVEIQSGAMTRLAGVSEN
ncbi:MAG: hypothetical protein CM1200mP22_01340 [Dehalococcoidia bacterium]|nr:MAG: hypothetical protein CM1200mP22_01340 [Dehalococcoidia bacterium]